MPSAQDEESSQEALEILLESKAIHVSFLSALLRTLQAVLRGVISEKQLAQEYFDRRPQPVVAVSTQIREGATHLRLFFVDPIDDTPLPRVGVETFEAFMEAFGQFLKEMPQRNLWGISSRSHQKAFPSEFLKRLDQVRIQLRRVSRATLSYRQHRITIERNGIDISG